MSEETSDKQDGSTDARAARVLAALEDAAGTVADDAADDAAPPSGEAEAAEPPVSWSKEEKEAFARLPAETRAAIARREGERERFLSARTQELARRERALTQERERVARELGTLIGEAERDPVVAEGRRTDWARLSAEDPASFARRWPAFEERLAALDFARAQHDRLLDAGSRADGAGEAELVAARAPELADPARRRAALDEVEGFLRAEGFGREEIAGLHDHRAFAIVLDAMRYRRERQARREIAGKRVATAPRVQKPGAAEEGERRGVRLAALKKRAAATGQLDDRAAYVLAALEDG